MKKYNILAFPCGSEIGLELFNSLQYCKELNLIGLSSVSDHGKYVYNNYIGDCPFLNDDNFITFVKDIVKKYNIDYIYPCLDLAIEKLKKHEQDLGCKVIGSPYKTTEIFLSKKKTYDYFKDILPVPFMLEKNNVKQYPIFSKPEIGSSSRGTIKIENNEDLEYWSKKYPNNLLLEYLPGEEYTVDCFTDKNRNLKFIGPRKRARISNGISVGSYNIVDESLNKLAHIINNNIEINGSWFFQVKKDKFNNYKLLEIASRFGGSSILNRVLGVNFAYLNILNEIYDNISILYNNLNINIDRSLNAKSNLNINFKNVYIDFDDTLVVNKKVNINLIKFIYNCINNKVNVNLITKHNKNILNSLQEYKINQNLFNNIIHINQNDNKYLYITDNLSIFIDDSFSERQEVYKNLGIPVFSPDVIEVLF